MKKYLPPSRRWSKTTKPGTTIIVIAILMVIFCLLTILFAKVPKNTGWFVSLLMIGSTSIVTLLITLLGFIFGDPGYKMGFMDFIIGDEGTYSLSRLQAVVWAIVIMSSQVATMFALVLNPHGSYFQYYQPIFSESSIWLLGLTLSSYVAVKGITNNKIQQTPGLYKSKIMNPRWRDILDGENGLDFSRCQMLVWTIIAIACFESKCFYFLDRIIIEQPDGIEKLFNHIYDEYENIRDKLDYNYPYVPYLPWTFVVLMGLSQGVYVGKKLVPSFKLDDIKSNRETQLSNDLQQLQIKQNLLNQLSSIATPATNTEKRSLSILQKQIKDLESEIADLQKDIHQINANLNQS